MRRILIWVCGLLWFAFVVYGFVAYMQIDPEGSGFTRGSNRIAAFFRWQATAMIPALVAYITGRRAGANGALRLASQLPVWISGVFFALIILVFIGALVLARLG